MDGLVQLIIIDSLMASDSESVKLVGMWASSFTHRVQLALKLKAVEFEYVEEDPSGEKSPQLLPHNPIYKNLPVLLHADNSLADSLVILEYIDETWKHSPIMPHPPFERALVRFWSRFVDDKLGPSVGDVFRLTAGGPEQAAAAIEAALSNLQVLEDELRDGFFRGRRFFGGEKMCVLDIVVGCGSYWLWVFEEVAGVKLLDPNRFPRFHSWLQDFEDQKEVKEIMPATHRLLEYAKGLGQMIEKMEKKDG
ncbi:hypothetical protein ACLOJK_000048 [Asimina triloba]